MSLAESDEDEEEHTDKHPKMVTPTEQYLVTRFIVTFTHFLIFPLTHYRNRSISEQRFVLSQHNPDSDATPSTPSGTTDDVTKKRRAKLVYQKASIDEEPLVLDQSLHDLPPHQETSHEQLPGNQTQDQASQDHQQPDDVQASDYSDVRSPSFMSLQNEACTVQNAKQRKAIVLEQPLLEETGEKQETPLEETPLEETPSEVKEDDESSSRVKEETDAPSEVLHEKADDDKSNTPGETKEEDQSSHTKEESNATSELLQIPSTSQQYRSLSVPSCPPQLKSILRRTNAPKSLSLDIHNLDDVQDGSTKRPPLVHKMSVSYSYK